MVLNYIIKVSVLKYLFRKPRGKPSIAVNKLSSIKSWDDVLHVFVDHTLVLLKRAGKLSQPDFLLILDRQVL